MSCNNRTWTYHHQNPTKGLHPQMVSLFPSRCCSWQADYPQRTKQKTRMLEKWNVIGQFYPTNKEYIQLCFSIEVKFKNKWLGLQGWWSLSCILGKALGCQGPGKPTAAALILAYKNKGLAPHNNSQDIKVYFLTYHILSMPTSMEIAPLLWITWLQYC